MMILTVHVQPESPARSEYPELLVNGISLDELLSDQFQKPEILNLVPAHAWLYDKPELALAWERILVCGDGQISKVPLLVCDGDMDLRCTVLVTEQKTIGDKVLWLRFGYSLDREINKVEWLPNSKALEFAKSKFIDAVFEYAELCDWSFAY